MKEIQGQYPNRAVMDFEGNYQGKDEHAGMFA